MATDIESGGYIWFHLRTMKYTLTLLLFLTFKMCFAQTTSGLNSLQKTNSKEETISKSNLLNFYSETVTPVKLPTKSKNCSKDFMLYFRNKKNNFNPFQIQQLNFTWSVLKVRLEINLITSASGIMQKMNLIQIQNPGYK
jgi:hypothetical protein